MAFDISQIPSLLQNITTACSSSCADSWGQTITGIKMIAKAESSAIFWIIQLFGQSPIPIAINIVYIGFLVYIFKRLFFFPFGKMSWVLAGITVAILFFIGAVSY